LDNLIIYLLIAGLVSAISLACYFAYKKGKATEQLKTANHKIYVFKQSQKITDKYKHLDSDAIDTSLHKYYRD